MKNTGSAFRVTGLVLGIVATVCGGLAIIFSSLAMHQARVCKHCEKSELYK